VNRVIPIARMRAPRSHRRVGGGGHSCRGIDLELPAAVRAVQSATKRAPHWAALTLAFSAAPDASFQRRARVQLVAARASCGDIAMVHTVGGSALWRSILEPPDEATARSRTPEPSVKHRPSRPHISPDRCPRSWPGGTALPSTETMKASTPRHLTIRLTRPRGFEPLTFGSVALPGRVAQCRADRRLPAIRPFPPPARSPEWRRVVWVLFALRLHFAGRAARRDPYRAHGRMCPP